MGSGVAVRAVATDPASAPAAEPRVRFTLRTIGVVAIVALAAYVASAGFYVARQRAELLLIVKQLEQTHGEHELLTTANVAIIHSIVSIQDALNSGDFQSYPVEIDFSLLASSLPRLKAGYPDAAPSISRLEQRFAALRRDRSLEAMTAFRDSSQEVAAQVESLIEDGHRQEAGLYDEYRTLNQHITSVIVLLSLLGLAAFGAGLIWFFSRLASDIQALQTRAVAIVGGYRGPPLPVERRDELGSLMHAVNRAQSELRKREQQQEISREQRFHQEKMAAIGSLAAAVAHEVSNPINAISGIAQYTLDLQGGARPLDEATLLANAGLILKQTERIGALMRRLADLAGPRSAQLEPTNVNELVESTCSFVRYDKRFRHIDLKLDLARDIPAVRAVSDHLTQVLMNLLINAADATEGIAGRSPAIRVSTRQAAGEVLMCVADNGQGMDAAVLGRAFADSFTTKPAGKGRGIGRYLCKKLIEEMAGRIALESTPGAGTAASVWLPSFRSPAT